MSESPAGARLNFAMRGDVRASPIEFSWGSQTVTSVTGALPLRGHLAGVAEHGGSVRFDLLLEAQAGRHLDRDRTLRTSSGSRGRSKRSMMQERERRRARACNCWHQVLGCEPNESVNADKCVSGPGARCPVYKNDVPFSDGAVIGSMLRPY
jgi:hypothetical protein